MYVYVYVYVHVYVIRIYNLDNMIMIVYDCHLMPEQAPGSVIAAMDTWLRHHHWRSNTKKKDIQLSN